MGCCLLHRSSVHTLFLCASCPLSIFTKHYLFSLVLCRFNSCLPTNTTSVAAHHNSSSSNEAATGSRSATTHNKRWCLLLWMVVANEVFQAKRLERSVGVEESWHFKSLWQSVDVGWRCAWNWGTHKNLSVANLSSRYWLANIAARNCFIPSF